MRPATLPVSPALPPAPFRPDPLRLLSAQADLQYHAAPSRGIFNPPAATGMGFWSINPYVGCAFGCAYCYARDAHRFTLERVGDIGRQVANAMPPWLAFERRVLVKERAGAAGRAAHRDAPAMLEALVQQVAAAGAKSLGAGVYVGVYSTKMRERLWVETLRLIGDGSAVMAWAAPTDSGFAFDSIGPNRRMPIDFDGLTLVQFVPEDTPSD